MSKEDRKKEIISKQLANRKFKGVFIPKEIWFDTNLKWIQKLFFIEIDSLSADAKRGCYASNTHFSAMFNLSNERCSQIITELKKLELIEVKYKREGQQIIERNIFITDKGIKYSKGGIKETLKKDNNINTIINNSIDDSDESSYNSSKKIDTPIEKEIHPIIAHWNSCQGTRKHQKQNTKVYKTAVKYIKQLQKGTFCIMSTFNIETTKILSSIDKKKKWTEQEIIETINDVIKIYQNGYWPQDKSLLPTDLASIFYNPLTQNSWFLRCWKNPPKKIAEEKKLKIKDQDLYNIYKQIIQPTESQERKFIMVMNRLHSWYEEVLEDIAPLYSLTNFDSYFGTAQRFAKQHIKWLEHQGQLHIAYCDPESSTNFKRFTNHVKTEFSFNLVPTKEELKAMQQNYKKEQERFKNRIAGRRS